jgi:hypothetical protein
MEKGETMPEATPINRRLTLLQWGAGAVAIVGVILAVLLAIGDATQFMQGYLVAYLFWLELSLGCLGLLLVTQLVDSGWGTLSQRIFAAGARTMPLLALLFLPLLLGLEVLYPATGGGSGSAAADAWLGPFLFIMRAVLYFAIWIAIAYFVTQNAYRMDENDDPALRRRAQVLSVIGLILLMVTTTFASLDWLMALDPKWFSSIYGWLSNSRQALSALAFVLVLGFGLLWRPGSPLAPLAKKRLATDLGTLMLVGLLAWIYLSFMQYVIIWSGNQADKYLWYEIRLSNGYGGIMAFLTLFHAVPVVLLLLPGIEQIRWGVWIVAAVLLLLRLVDMYWLVMPALRPEFILTGADVVLPLAIGGLWVAFFTWGLLRARLIPTYGPGAAPVESEEEGYEPSRPAP